MRKPDTPYSDLIGDNLRSGESRAQYNERMRCVEVGRAAKEAERLKLESSLSYRLKKFAWTAVGNTVCMAGVIVGAAMAYEGGGFSIMGFSGAVIALVSFGALLDD